LYAKLFQHGRDVLVAASDKELIGKEFKDDRAVIHVSERFYKGDRVDEAQLAKLMDSSSIGNLVGKKVIKVAMEKGLVQEKDVLTIGGTPHVQYVKMK